MASLKERMAMFNKSARKSDADDHAEFKKKSGNTEQPEKVGKLNHSYLSRDSNKSTKPKRNFKISRIAKKKKDQEEETADQAEDTNAATESKPASTVKTPKSPKKRSKAGRISTFVKNDMTGMLKNPFLAGDKRAKSKVEQKQAAKREEEMVEDSEALALAEEGEDDFVIPEGDEDAEDAEEEGEPKQELDRSARGMLRSFVQQSQRLSLGVFQKKKDKPAKRSQSMDVMNSQARSGAGIQLHRGTSAPPPRKRLSLLVRMGSSRRNNGNKMNARHLVLDKARAPEVEDYLNKINEFNSSFTMMKRLSIRDNDIVQAIQKVIGNDPKQTKIMIDTDVRFNHLRSSMVVDFGDSIRKNLYLKTLTIRGVDLGNTFLEALASAIRDNVTLKEIDLSRNSFTHDALVEFCQALELNQTITTVRLQTQMSPIYKNSIETVLEALDKNRSIKSMMIDFQGDNDGKYEKRLKEITQRNYWNEDNYPMPNPDDLLVNFLKEEVVRAEEQHKLEMLEKDLEEIHEGDWDYLYELSVLFDRFKIKNEDEESRGAVQSYASPMHAAQGRISGGELGTQGRNPLTGAQGFPSDGSFLTEEFIDMYLQEDPERGTLVFNFCNQARLFKQFPSTSPDRETIVNIFVYELLHHPRQHEFTGINMTNTGCGNDFWEKISEFVLEDPDLLPNMNMISAETNFLTEPGIVAIANLIKTEKAMRYLQIVKLDNQKALLSSKAERALARAMCVNLGIVRFSLRVRNLLERDECNKYVLRNIDFLRQARRHHKISTGTLKERKRNAMEQYFDSIAANDESITEVNISADINFTGLNDAEKIKSAKAFATNSHVKKVTMNQLQLGDKFAIALGEALEQNNTIERLVIEGNAFTGAGFKEIFAGLGKNSSIKALLAGHQTKSMSSPDEQALPGLLEGNTTITKISLDLRNSAVTMQLDKICNHNRHKRISAQAPTERKRNAMEQYFDKIAADDESITEVNLSADVKFTGLSSAEKVKSAKAFATNSHVTKVTMNQLQLGDDFLIALGESLETNTTIERLVIEGNSFTGVGFKRLFSGLGKNSSVKELLGKHQTKSMASSDEQALPAFIEENTIISKISLDLRNSAVTMALDKICYRNNHDYRRKKNSSATATSAAENAAAAVASTPEEATETSEAMEEEKPFDEEAPHAEKSQPDETPMDEVEENKAAKGETPFDERSADQPFDEAGPEDEASPPEDASSFKASGFRNRDWIPESTAQLSIRITNQATKRFKDLLVPASQDVNMYDGIYANKSVLAANIRKWPDRIVGKVKAGEAEIKCALVRPDESVIRSFSIEELKSVNTVDIGGFVKEEQDVYRLLLSCEEGDLADEVPETSEKETVTFAPTQLGETEEKPDAVEQTEETGAEEEGDKADEEEPTEEEDAEPEPPTVIEVGEGDEIEVSVSQEEEAPVTSAEAVAEENEEEPKAPTVIEAGEGEEIEVSAAPEGEPEEAGPATPEETPAEEEATESETPAGDAPSEEEEAAEAETPAEDTPAEENEAEPEAPVEESLAEEEEDAEPEAPVEDTPAEKDEAAEPEILAEDTPAEEAAAEPEPPVKETPAEEGEDAEPEAPGEDTLAEEEAAEPEPPAVVQAADGDEVEVAAVTDAPQEEEPHTTSEDTQADEKEVEGVVPTPPEEEEPEVPAVVEAGEGEEPEVAAPPTEEKLQEAKPELTGGEEPAEIEESEVEENDGKSAESWDVDPNLND